MLIPLLLNDYEHDNASPPLNEIEDNGKQGLLYNGVPVSYRFPLKFSIKNGEIIENDERWYNFMSELVDIDRTMDIVKCDKFFKKHKQLSNVAWRNIVEDFFNEHHENMIDDGINYVARSIVKSNPRVHW